MKIEMIYKRPALRISLHILFWLAFFGVQYHITQISFNTSKKLPVVNELLVTNTLRLILFYYPFVYWVLPRFFYRKRFIVGMLLAILLVIVYAFTNVLEEEFIIKPCTSCLAVIDGGGTGFAPFLHLNMPNRLLLKVMSLGMFIGAAFNIAFPLSIKMALQAFRQQLRAVQLSKENLQLEFNFLRSQVNPHFLFNTLNNIYGLILKDEKERSAETVARLSQFLRYSLYESTSEQVAVTREIQLLKDYVALESLRLNHISVSFHQGSDGSVATIAPLLLMPLIENSFKHTKDEAGAFIKLDLQIINKQIVFSSINSTAETKSAGGIGLNNVQKRLELYYPKRHNFTVHNNPNQFEVAINIHSHE